MVASRAASQGTGARGLMTILEAALRPFNFQLPSTSITRLEVCGPPSSRSLATLANAELATPTLRQVDDAMIREPEKALAKLMAKELPCEHLLPREAAPSLLKKAGHACPSLPAQKEKLSFVVSSCSLLKVSVLFGTVHTKRVSVLFGTVHNKAAQPTPTNLEPWGLATTVPGMVGVEAGNVVDKDLVEVREATVEADEDARA